MIPTDIVKTALSNVWVRYVIILVAGIAIGAIFYPSKTMKETISKQYEQQIQTLTQQHSEQLKQVSNTYDQTINSMKTSEQQNNEKIQQLSTQVSDLQSHTKTTTYKIVHPDGTIEEKDSTEADVDQNSTISTQVQAEYQQKLTEQQTTLEATHQQQMITQQQVFDQKEATYQQTIKSLQETKTVTTNTKKFGVEAGVLTNSDYYGHITYTVFGPMFVGFQAQFGPNPAAGAGVGISF